MKQTAKTAVGPKRKEQIVDAAAEIVTELGIQKLSLSEIEKRTKLCRGQLTYYFRTKEQILIALYDRVIRLMHERFSLEAPDCLGGQPDPHMAGERLNMVLEMVLKPDHHLVNQHMHALQHTFLSQISHREDLREKLAELYRNWRHFMSQDIASLESQNDPAFAGPEAAAEAVAARAWLPAPKDKQAVQEKIEPTSIEIATVYQALLHGLAMQIAADPNCVDRARMAKICSALLGDLVSSSKKGEVAGPPCSTTMG